MKINSAALTKDIKDYFNIFGKAYVISYLNEVEEKAKYAIRCFYNSYEPKYYKRQFYFLNNSLNKITVLNNKTRKRGVLDLLAVVRFSGNDIYEDSSDDDYDIRVLNWLGYHGNADYTTTPDPIDILMSHCNRGTPHNIAIKKAKKFANMKSYSCLKK